MQNGQMNASAYVQGNRLCILGIYQSPWGAIPFSHACPCEAENGQIDFGKDVNPNVQAAIDDSQRAIMSKVEKEKIRLAAEELVDRTRAGDQNAAAMMVMVKRNAAEGFPRAEFTLECMNRYARSATRIMGETSSTALAKEITSDQPVHVQTALNGILPAVNGLRASVILSNGPHLDKKRVNGMIAQMDDDEKREFVMGFKNWKSNTAINSIAGKIGKCVGYARAIQRVRDPNTSISVLSDAAAWELD